MKEEKIKPERKERLVKIQKLQEEMNQLIEVDIKEHLKKNLEKENFYFTIETGERIKKFQYVPAIKFSNNGVRISQYIVGESDFALVKWVMDDNTCFRAIDRIIKITARGLAIQFGITPENKMDKEMGTLIELSQSEHSGKEVKKK